MEAVSQQFELPFLEDIYDMETEDLERILAKIDSDMQIGSNCQLPVGIESFEKYQRKAAKLKDSLELELEERAQVDNVLNFFQDPAKNFLDDDVFYRLDDKADSGTTVTQDKDAPSMGSFLGPPNDSDYLNGAQSSKQLGLQQPNIDMDLP